MVGTTAERDEDDEVSIRKDQRQIKKIQESRKFKEGPRHKQRVYNHAARMTADGHMIRAKVPPHEQDMQNDTMTSAFIKRVGTMLPSDAVVPEVEVTESEFVAKVDNSSGMTNKDVLLALGGGTGATIGGTGILDLDIDLVRRMRYQDKAVMVLLLVMYFITLCFSASFAYKTAINNSPVTFYADPRFHDMVVEGREQDAFLEVFAAPPKDVHLQVTGFLPVTRGVVGSIEWNGEYYCDVFSFSLDLSQWVVREASTDGTEEGPWVDNIPLVDGIAVADMDKLNYHVGEDSNDLALLELQKEVAWPGWEELATNIKHKIRQQGFNGIISINRTERDKVSIYKNTTWANFMHSRTTKVLCALSVLGWIIYLPYMWLRCSPTLVRARYRIDIPIEEYWRYIADKLTCDGFVEDPDAPRRSSRTGQLGMGQLTVYNSGRFGILLGDGSDVATAGWAAPDSQSVTSGSVSEAEDPSRSWVPSFPDFSIRNH